VAAETDDADIAAMLRLRDGDNLALNELMARWQRRLIGYLLRLTDNQTVACDLAEETFVRIYQNRGRYQSKAAFSTWLFAVATNLLRDHLRWQRRHSTVSMDAADGSDAKSLGEKIFDPRPDPGKESELGERSAAVRNAILALPDDQRQPLVLFEYEGLSHEEIAHVMKCTPKAVESRLYRARLTLREKLEKLLAS
jgi:RNA polymerase sigma-70 factor (ECF subfamily)